MTPKAAKRLARALTRDFGPPYLPEGFVCARSDVWPERERGHHVRQTRRVVLSLRIGPRDADFDLSTGEDLGGGTLLAHGWRITGRTWLHVRKRPARPRR